MSIGTQEVDELVARPPIDTSLLASWSPDRFGHIYLYRESNLDDYRYRLTVVDRKLLATTPLNHATAVVLIPAGRESEYMFRTCAGLQAVAESASCARLIAVAMGRRHEFTDSQEDIQHELAFVAQAISMQGRFLPPGHHKRYLQSDTMLVIPFLALDGVGSRNVVAEGATELSGTYLVEQVKVNDTTVRRLYFMENPFVIQSEVVMNGHAVDKTVLAFEYHKYMAAGLLSLTLQRSQGVVVGLGGGGLVNFLQTVLPSTSILVVELDRSVVTPIAEQYFGFQQNERTTVHIGDGLSLCSADEAETQNSIVIEPASLDFIVIDVDSKDKTVGMSCPPRAFVETSYLTRLKSLLQPDGWLILNVSARDPAMFQLVKKNVQAVFGSVVCSNTDDDDQDVNIVVFATISNVSLSSPTDRIDALHKSLDEFVKSAEVPVSWHETLSQLEDCVASVKDDSDALAGTPDKRKKKNGGKRKKGKRR